MKRQIVLIIVVLSSFNDLFGQSDIIVVRAREMVSEVMLPVVSKPGKDPKLRKVTITTYSMTYVHNIYRGSKWLTVGKYIETYKGKVIKELIYDTELLETRGFNRDDISNRLVIVDIVNTPNSTTDFKSICCRYDTYSDTPIFKSTDMKINSVIRNKQARFSTRKNFYDPVSSDFLITRLRSEDFKDSGIQELLELKTYMDKKYEKYSQYERKLRSLVSTNTNLKNQIRNFTPNIYGKDSPNISVVTYTHENIQFRFLEESFLWDPHNTSSLESAHLGHLLIQYPKGSPYEGEVYLKQVKTDGNGYLKIMEVYKQNTKKEAPFKWLMTKDYNGFNIFGLEGTMNNDSTFLSDTQQHNSKDAIKSFKLKRDLVAKYENEKFKNYYLLREFPIRETGFKAHQTRLALEQVRKVKQEQIGYEKEKNESLIMNGFFLETRDFKNESDNDIDYRLNLIYKGEFNSSGYVNINGYSTKAFEDLELQNIIYSVMYRNAKKCKVRTPVETRVEIYEDICIEETVTTNQWGRQINWTCSDWGKKATGLFTSKKIYGAFNKQKQKTNSIGGLVNLLDQVTDHGKLYRTQLYINELKKDIDKIYRMNDCNSKALIRFEENLVRYINGQEPLKLN